MSLEATTDPQVRLVEPDDDITKRTWDIPFPTDGSYVIRGHAGSGLTSFLADTVLNHIENGASADSILVVAASKESGALLREDLTTRLAAGNDDFVAEASMVRSVHSLAFALLRQDSEEDIRLITGAEQDAVIRELLQGHVDTGAGAWPADIRPALGYVGFARQLRDFLLRAIERQQTPDSLIELGKQYSQPMWSAAGKFLREYERVMALSGIHSYSAAELVTQVLLRPHLTDNHPWETIVVDEAQLLDPTSGELIRRLAATAKLVVIGGDPDQAVFAFRGATTDFLETFPAEHHIELHAGQRAPEPACVSIVDSERTQRDVLADFIRRRHLDDGVAWKDIACIVRSSGDLGPVRRTLLAAGVPVHINPTDVVLSEQRLVSAILLAVKALDTNIQLTNSEIEDLFTGPIGGADPVGLRRLIRALRRWQPELRGMDMLRDIITRGVIEPDLAAVLNDYELSTLQHTVDILNAGREVLGGSPEDVLWAIWSKTGLANRLLNSSLRGGATGSQADRDLDAMMALFDAAGDYSERRPGASLEAFTEHIVEQELPTGVRDRRTAVPDAVSILTAHGAVGREFDTVAVIGAQEGSWPALGETGTIFAQEELIDLIDDGIDPNTPVNNISERLVQERRLFHVATTRHTARMLIVAIDNPDGDEVAEPSRFIDEFTPRRNLIDTIARAARQEAFRAGRMIEEMGLTKPDTEEPAVELETELDPLQVSVLSISTFIAKMRKFVGDKEASESEKAQAARQLARLADAGVPGAHPSTWWATRTVAEERSLADNPRLSPSRIEALLTCPLNAMLANAADNASEQYHLIRGNLAHAFLEALGRGVDKDIALEETVAAFEQIQTSPQWKRKHEREEFERLLQRTHQWVEDTRGVLELVDVEVRVDVEAAPGVRISGYMDRLERALTEDQGLRVIDLKTGSYKPSDEETSEHPQLLAYQLVLAHGLLSTGDNGTRVLSGKGEERDGATLVYPGTSTNKIATAEQARKDDEQLAEFAEKLPPLLDELRGPRVTAQLSSECERCPVISICPVHTEGKVTTDANS
ncbi:PD-(D/E)XK nuclease family protein [Corynebacterium sp. L4756]|uniref:PD-(D/E)XK nuclease family protein n=1 Tax=unclassified Corynebacterium TaxID=2624378 RepID=UPI00374D7009